MMKHSLRKWLFLSMIGIGGVVTGCAVKTQSDDPRFASDEPPDIAQPLPPLMGSLFNRQSHQFDQQLNIAMSATQIPEIVSSITKSLVA
jgi:hypothetical protein